MLRTILVASLSIAFVLGGVLRDSITSPHEKDRVTSLPDYGQLLSKNYAGYIDQNDNRRAFYWFIESQGNPETDPLVLWLNGGPGCSSLMGTTEENGPYVMRHGGNFVENDFAFTKLANVLYLESPMGVGYSVDSVPPIVWNDTNTAEYSYAFLKKWFDRFPHYKNHSLYLGGESYAGHYVPQLADQILEGDDAHIRKMMKGFMVGNPCTGDIGCANPDPTLMPYLQYQGFAPLNGTIPIEKGANYDPYDILVPTCPNKAVLSRVRFPHPVLDALRRRLDAAPAPFGPCADTYVTNWFNRADVKRMLHAEENITWVECSNSLNYTFNFSGVTNLYQKFMDHTTWDLMIYSGLSDSVVNMAQTQTIVNGMKRPLAVNKYQEWNYPYVYDANATQLGGFFLQFDRISWAGVRDAGHMVPQFNPPAALGLFKSFLKIGRPGLM